MRSASPGFRAAGPPYHAIPSSASTPTARVKDRFPRGACSGSCSIATESAPNAKRDEEAPPFTAVPESRSEAPRRFANGRTHARREKNRNYLRDYQINSYPGVGIGRIAFSRKCTSCACHAVRFA